MYCGNCGAELSAQSNFCPYCGSALQSATTSISLLNKAASTAQSSNEYNLVLISRGTCSATMAGDLLEDVFGYTDAESGNLVSMAPVVVGENLTAEEAATVAQLYTEYGMQVSVTDSKDQYVDLSSKANTSLFDNTGKLLSGAAAIIGALTVANRISSYRRYKKPSLLERLFRIHYKPEPPVYQRNFRPKLNPQPLAPRRTIRKPEPQRNPQPQRMQAPGHNASAQKPFGSQKPGDQTRPGNAHGGQHGGQSGRGNGGPGGWR